ncbi:unnamed protein product [Alopecurus aequalis]
MFAAATTVTIGNGEMATFWESTWLLPLPLRSAFPALFKHSARKRRSVSVALTDNVWIRDVRRNPSDAVLHEFLELWRLLRTSCPTLEPGTMDKIRWNPAASGRYSAGSAYRLQFLGSTASPFQTIIWKQWAPPRCKFFSWLLLQDRLWCADRLMRRGWPNNYLCPLCMRSLESSLHLFGECPVTKQVWLRASRWEGCRALDPALWPPLNSILQLWMDAILASQLPTNTKGLNSMIILISWEIWLERNRRVFSNKKLPVRDILLAIRRSMDSWRLAGAICLAAPFGDPLRGIG